MSVIDFNKAKEDREAKKATEDENFEWDHEEILNFADELLVDLIITFRNLNIDYSNNPHFPKDAYAVHICLLSMLSRLTGVETEYTMVVDKMFYEHFGDVPLEHLSEIFSVDEVPDE